MQEGGRERIWVKEEELARLVCTVNEKNDMIVYISDPKNSTRELLQLKNTFSKLTGYKMN